MVQANKSWLTIGIPTYNGGENLLELFDSIKLLGLSSDEYEILVVDNCSEDDTEAIINKLKPHYSNLRYHKNPNNIGRIENWNKVIELTQGDYLIIMNINDRFLKFNIKKHLQYLDQHPLIPVVFANINTANYIYPNWLDDGVVKLDPYIKKTFLDRDYLEFNSLGVLHQHIFRTKIITNNNIWFDAAIPRTTDRVFTAQVILAGEGAFYYTPEVMVSWHLNKNRYHYSVHNDPHFNFDELWGNEYKANLQISGMANISYKDFLKGQLIFARFNKYVKKVRYLKSNFFKIITSSEKEISTIDTYYTYLKVMAELNKVSINYFFINVMACLKAWNWFAKSRLLKKNQRSLHSITNPANS